MNFIKLIQDEEFDDLLMEIIYESDEDDHDVTLSWAWVWYLSSGWLEISSSCCQATTTWATCCCWRWHGLSRYNTIIISWSDGGGCELPGVVVAVIALDIVFLEDDEKPSSLSSSLCCRIICAALVSTVVYGIKDCLYGEDSTYIYIDAWDLNVYDNKERLT